FSGQLNDLDAFSPRLNYGGNLVSGQLVVFNNIFLCTEQICTFDLTTLSAADVVSMRKYNTRQFDNDVVPCGQIRKIPGKIWIPNKVTVGGFYDNPLSSLAGCHFVSQIVPVLRTVKLQIQRGREFSPRRSFWGAT